MTAFDVAEVGHRGRLTSTLANLRAFSHFSGSTESLVLLSTPSSRQPSISLHGHCETMASRTCLSVVLSIPKRVVTHVPSE